MMGFNFWTRRSASWRFTRRFEMRVVWHFHLTGRCWPRVSMRRSKSWRLHDGRELDTLLGVFGAQSVAFAPDGKTLAAGGTNIITWEWPSGRELANIKIDPWATHLIFAPDGKTLVAATYTGVKVFEAPGLRLLRRIGDEEPTALALSPDGKLLAWAARTTPIRLVDLTNGREVATLTGHTDVVQTLAFSPDGARLVSWSGNDNTIRAWGVAQ